nr:LPS-assembly protein LptD [Cupriavidus sp. USMAHM13]
MAGRLPASALRPLVLAMAGWWSAGLHAQAVGSGIPDLPVAEPAVEQAPEVPPVAGQLVPKLPEPETVRKEPDARPPVFVSGDRMDGYNERGVAVQGDAELRNDGKVIKGDRLTYDQDTDEAFVQGNARLSQNGTLAVGPEGRMRVEANEGYMLSPDYYFQQTGGNGKAERIDFLDKDHTSIQRTSYTTCSPDNADWYFSARQVDIDNDRQVGVAYGAVMRFFDVPVFATPMMSFPLTGERRSGVLAPLFSYGSRSGFDVTVPYYFNIAPNRDLTLYPRVLTSRGFQLGEDFRYLGDGYSGRIRGEFLPDDQKTGTNRWAYSVQHSQLLAPGLGAYVNVNKVSDDAYPTDLTRSLSQATTFQYTQEGGVTYNWNGLSVLARVQKFQTLAPNGPSYNREPQLNVKYSRYDLGGFDVQVESDYSRFRIPLTTTGFQQPEGDRLFIQPSISYPIVRAGWYVKPKLIFNATQYQMEAASNTPGNSNSLTRTVPTFSVDSGMTFERDAPGISRLFGVNYVQTLEPRLFYVYTPFRDQGQFPLFDTVQSDFGYGQIFTENPFTGYDRIADNNKVTVGVTTRLIEAETGVERFRGTLAQRVNFKGQQVQIGGSPTIDASSGPSDLLGAATVQLFRGYYLDTALQYNPDTDRVDYTNVSFAWRPETRKLFNIGYRYRRATSVTDNSAIDQLETSSQWPLTRRLYGIGRVAFDLSASQLVDALVGFEYAADCWVGRFVYQRFRNTTNGYTGRFFFQVELRGLSKIGTNPLDLLRLNVPGYQPVPVQAVQPSQLDHYE